MGKRIAISVFGAALFAALFLWSADALTMRVAARPWRPGAPTKVVEIPAGHGLDEVGNLLAREGVIRSSFVFQFYAWRRGLNERLQAGEYELDPGMSSAEIAGRIARGEVRPRGVLVIIPEGTRLTELIDRFRAAGLPQADALAQMRIGRWRDDFSFLPTRSDRTLEGYLFPDTYRFLPDVSADDVTAKLLTTFERRVLTREIQSAVTASGRTLDEVVIMASLLEREVRSDEDQQLVAGILWKRLDAGTLLQVDATVAYLAGKKTTALTIDDLAIESPYNTYRHTGLPDGPINNPGTRSIRNALNQKLSDYWFYLSKPDGSTVFSRTSQEHEAAIRQFLRL